MPLEIKTLKVGTLNVPTLPVTLSTTQQLYEAPNPTSGQKKAAIIHGMRFTNAGTQTTAVIQVYVAYLVGTVVTNPRRILPKSLKIPPGFTIIDDDQITLGAGDGIYAYAETTNADIQYALSGAERPV